MNQYIISKNQKLSDIMTEIEPNINLAKKFPGIGATYLEIHSHRPSILIEPNVPVIQGKCAKSDDDFKLFGVYEGVSIDAITRYLQKPNPYHKLMTTPESFQKVKQAVNNVGIDLYSHFFCLMDESHLLVKDVDYRENIVLPMNDFFLFKQKALVSATPIALSDPRFKAQGFRTVTIDADYDYRQEITVIHSNNSLQSIREYLKEHDTPVCFFINLVDYSHSLIKELGIENESSIFCAPKSALKLKHELNFHNAYDEWRADRMRSFNFFTSRFYNAFDLELAYSPHVVMLTDIKESDKGYELEMDLPGFKKEEIKASIENGYLIISAEKGLEKDEKESEGKKYICRERYTGSCQRAFYVGDDIEKDDIKASFKHGILHLDIPKKQPKPQVEENKFISIEG